VAELKTKPTDQSVVEFLNAIPGEKKRRDSFAIVELMKEVTGLEPKMWGTSIVGLGSYHYKYASGHEGDAPLTGFSPRKQNLTLYLHIGFDRNRELLGRLGKFTTGKGCLYIKKLEDVDLPTLKQLIELSVDHMIATNP
jgi:hypothetical protein